MSEVNEVVNVEEMNENAAAQQPSSSTSFFILTVFSFVEDLITKSETGIVPFSQKAELSPELPEPVYYDDSQVYVETDDLILYPLVTGYQTNEDGTFTITGVFEAGNLDLMIRVAVKKDGSSFPQIWIDDPYMERDYFMYIQNGELKIG